MKKVEEVYEKIMKSKEVHDKSSDMISNYSIEKCKVFQATDSKVIPPFRPQQTFGSTMNISSDMNSSRFTNQSTFRSTMSH